MVDLGGAHGRRNARRARSVMIRAHARGPCCRSGDRKCRPVPRSPRRAASCGKARRPPRSLTRTPLSGIFRAPPLRRRTLASAPPSRSGVAFGGGSERAGRVRPLRGVGPVKPAGSPSKIRGIATAIRCSPAGSRTRNSRSGRRSPAGRARIVRTFLVVDQRRVPRSSTHSDSVIGSEFAGRWPPRNTLMTYSPSTGTRCTAWNAFGRLRPVTS